MSEELLRADALRGRIADYQERNPAGLSGHAIKQIGELATIDPIGALMVAENVSLESTRINALVWTGSKSGDIGPIAEGWEIAQSEVLDGLAARGRKLEFIAKHALSIDPRLALEIARSNEHSPTKVKSMITIAVHTKDPELISQANDIVARQNLGKDFNASLMWHAQSLNYEVGISAAHRAIQQQMARPSWHAPKDYGSEHALKDWALYVINCVLDAHEKADYLRLRPITDEVAEAMTWYADNESKMSDYKLFDGVATHSRFRYHAQEFDFMPETVRLAEDFKRVDPEASLKLLLAAQKMVATQAEKVSLIIETKNRPKADNSAQTLLDEEAFARELGLLEIPD